jgi:hypothetical protein
MRQQLLVLILIMASGCGYSTGSNFDDTKLVELVKGRTTYSEVVSSLGEPDTFSRQGDGSMVIVYQYTNLSQSPLGFVPVVGQVAGLLGSSASGYSMTMKHATLSFDAEGILQSWSYNETGPGAPEASARMPLAQAHPAPPPRYDQQPLSSIGPALPAGPPFNPETMAGGGYFDGPVQSPNPVVQDNAPLSGRRIALVIGNDAYRSIGQLRNPANDAQLVARALQQLGYSLVGGRPQLNLDRARFESAIQDFGRTIPGADVALFYYAGHGLQVDGANWLVPVDAELSPRKQDLPFQMIAADDVLLQMDGAGTQLNLVVLDACRNNPLANRGLRDAGRGLAEMQAPAGSMIAYATQPGNVALDGDGPNSPYSAALADGMRQRAPDVFHLFNGVGLRVQEETDGSQVPWTSSSPIRTDVRFSGV